MPVYVWLAAFIVLLLAELPTMALTTIWFAGGALVSCLAAIVGAGLRLQLLIFVAVSFALLIFTRPFVMRYVNRNVNQTNVKSLIGRKARVTSKIDNERGMGAAVVGGGRNGRLVQRETRILLRQTHR